MSDYENVNRFFRSVSMYYKTLSNRIDFDEDSECSLKEERQEIKQEIEKNDCNISPNYRNV